MSVLKNQNAKKWTDKKIIEALTNIKGVLIEDASGEVNPIRANDIKFIEEACMCAGVSIWSWCYFLDLMKAGRFPDGSPVFQLIKEIKKICELRLCYSGTTMDIFLLKNHYQYNDGVAKSEVDVTTKGQPLPAAERTVLKWGDKEIMI